MSFNPMDLTEKTILVTGASSGIGKETAVTLSKLGAKVVLLARNEERLQQTLGILSGEGHTYYTYDLDNVDGIPALMQRIAKDNGLLSGVFHSAGIGNLYAVNRFSEARILSIFNNSILAGLLLARGFMQPGVRADGMTSLVFMSSVSSIKAHKAHTIYAAAKAAINGAVRSLALELAPKKVRANAIAAGWIQTEMVESAFDVIPDDSLKKLQENQPLGLGLPEDIANAAAFLLSGASKLITGTVMVVDGGYTA